MCDESVAVDVVVEGLVDSAQTEDPAQDAGVVRCATSGDVAENGVEKLHGVKDLLACGRWSCVLRCCRGADLAIPHCHHEMFW